MLAGQRKERIAELVTQNGRVFVADLAEQFGVTRVTIRNDLESLENRGVLERTHGGAISAENPGFLRYITDTIHENADKKEAIADAAARMIEPSTTVMIDSGSTTAYLARRIRDHHVTVVTNSALVAQELVNAEPVELLITGGALRRPSMAYIGEPARLFLSQTRTDLMFLGATGFDIEHGISCTNLIEAETKRSMMKSSLKVCLVADSSKLGKVSMARICGWEDIDVFISDDIDPELAERLELLGVETISAHHFQRRRV
ncbi:MAG: DeoR/GlpR family DNA-binding transcription regulator [Spirochaetota bacterium]|nr:DeoR/GlpR family DNA-binding transcription regulator [Spirochaetota bacterium]